MKSKLPFLKKGKTETTDESEETTGLTDISDLESEDDELSSEDNSLLHKIKSKIGLLNKKKLETKDADADEEEEDEDDEDDSEAEKKKRNGKIVRIAIVVALIVFLASDYIFPPDEDESTPAVAPVAEKVRTPKVKEPVAVPEKVPETVVETPEPEVIPEVIPEVVPEPVIETVKPDDNSSSTTYTPDTSPVDISSNSEEPVAEPEAPDTMYGEDNSISDSGVPDVSDGDDFTDQILQDLEKQATPAKDQVVIKKYVAPPEYEYRGRGLVYNCQGKHWACVDAPSYKICEDNASSTGFLNKPTECHPFNVYETVRGCEITQNRMVSSGAKTKFCDE